MNYIVLTFGIIVSTCVGRCDALEVADAGDRLVQVNDADGWSQGTMTNANVLADAPCRIVLGFRTSEYPRSGTWVGPEVETEFPFSELIASFNASTPENAGITLDVRVEQNGAWSPWIYLQSWGRTLTPPDRVAKWDGGRASVDTLLLEKPAAKYQARIGLISFDFDPAAPPPSVRRLSVCYTGNVSDPVIRIRLKEKRDEASTRPVAPDQWAKDLGVPFHGQGELSNPKAVRGMICSPTSVSMVLEYFGIVRPPMENAAAIYDSHYDLFGNWGRAVARAGELGLDGYVTRFRNWDQVHETIARGVPVIASIRFREGEARGLLYDHTTGHLLVVRGFKPDGGVIVNDPADRTKGNGVVYRPEELAKAWFNAGGVGYVIEKPKAPGAGMATGPTPSTLPSTLPSVRTP